MEDCYDHNDPNIAYVPTNIPGKDCNEDLFDSEPCPGCQCSSDGKQCSDQTSGCQCIVASGRGSNYGPSGLLVNTSSPVIECRSSCGCSPESCLNRVVQIGPIECLEVRYSIFSFMTSYSHSFKFLED